MVELPEHMVRMRLMTKNQLKKPKLKHPFSEVPKHKGILAITEGHDWKPVTRMGRFINANHPPKDATKEELETIARFWGKPTPEDLEWAKSLRNRVAKQKNTRFDSTKLSIKTRTQTLIQEAFDRGV